MSQRQDHWRDGIRFSARKSAVDVWWMIGIMSAVGELVRCTDGSWMTRSPQSCPHGHLFRPGAMLVGHQPCGTCRGGHTTWTCLECGGVVYGPPLTAGCRILVGAAAVR
jgi:hypothetical protein